MLAQPPHNVAWAAHANSRHAPDLGVAKVEQLAERCDTVLFNRLATRGLNHADPIANGNRRFGRERLKH